MIHSIIPMRAVTKGRPRLGRRRRVYTPAKTEQFEREFARRWQEQNPDHELLTGPLGMQVIVGSNHIEVTVWELESGTRPKYIQGDVDNYVKAISDSLNGVAYNDDKQIHHVEAWLTKEVIDNEPD